MIRADRSAGWRVLPAEFNEVTWRVVSAWSLYANCKKSIWRGSGLIQPPRPIGVTRLLRRRSFAAVLLAGWWA
jgi:hypothetical protein